MADPEPRLFQHTFLEEMMRAILSRLDVPPDECATVVGTLMEATLSGYDSHGVMRIPMYVNGIRNGHMIPGASMKHLQETPASLHLDARFALGPVSAAEAVRLASTKAGEMGIGCVSVVNANDIARLGSYLLKPAEDGLVALMLVNDAGGNPTVAPWGGRAPFLSTNPLAAGIPWRPQMPILIDISSSVVSLGKLKMLAARGASPPDGWVIDEAGEALIDLGAILTVPRKGALLPLGSPSVGHKGFALSLLVDILAGGLSGAGCSTGEETGRDQNGFFTLAIDPDKFISLAQFTRHVDALVTRIKNSPRASDVDEILIPGERAYRQRQERALSGIPVDGQTCSAIGEILRELGLHEKYPLQ
ncbi:MAG TPA: Ldh family oxidoreductase [Candidatus Latescibacteria bacterium]|nr:Ldh family oxidoreductase [Candidatus Latescibacterota bacterium]